MKLNEFIEILNDFNPESTIYSSSEIDNILLNENTSEDDVIKMMKRFDNVIIHKNPDGNDDILSTHFIIEYKDELSLILM